MFRIKRSVLFFATSKSKSPIISRLHCFITTSLVLLSFVPSLGQTVNFNDSELKRYLINEFCVDTTQNGTSFSNDISVDLNGDAEIQLTEAHKVKALELNDFPDAYSIKSLLDLNEFPNLKYLKIIDNDSLERISNLTLDSLKTLWISDGVSLKHIDISNLPGITTTLRIEGITTLDTLNIQNGTAANQFSLFYSQNIKYACIDSISAEVNEFSNAGAMQPGASPSFNCRVLTINETNSFSHRILIYPNPANDYVVINTAFRNVNSIVFSITGEEVLNTSEKTIDLQSLSSGVYFVKCKTPDIVFTKKLIVKN